VAAYQVSGEFAMLHAAADRGWLDLPRAMMETAIALRRAGADLLITYFARDVAAALQGRAIAVEAALQGRGRRDD
jgi:porphobilinogen synthase